MKKRILSIILSIVMILGMIPFSVLPAFAAGEGVHHFDYFTVWPESSISFGSGKDVSFSGDGKTMYVNTTVYLRVTALQPNVHVVIRSDATVYMASDTASMGDIHVVSSPYIKVESGKNVTLLLDRGRTIRSTNTSVIENNGTLRLQCGELSLVSEGGSAISGSGTLISEVGNLTVNAVGGAGIVQGGAVSFKDSTVTATAGDNYPAIAGNPVNIENCVVTATGGGNAAGIGGGSTIAFSQINISGSLITANGGACGIGAGSKAAAEPNKVVIDPLSSVKSTINAGAVVNGNGEDVFLQKTDNIVGSAITVNGEAIRWRGHGTETCLYLYLPEAGSVIGYDSSVTIDSFYITALCDDFPFNDLVFDAQSGLLTVKTEKPFSIKNLDPSAATSNHILIDSKGGANITLAGVYIRAPENAPAIAYASYEGVGDVTLTTVRGTENYLCGGDEAEGIRKPNGLTDETLGNKPMLETLLKSNPRLTIRGEGFIAIAGNEAEGIGSPTGTANVQLLSGAITVTGDYEGSAIGGGETDGYPKADVVIGEWASVLYEDGFGYTDLIERGKVPEARLVNENGEKVYPAQFPFSGSDTILLDGRELPFKDHGGRKSFCFYRPGGSLFFYTDSKLYRVGFHEKFGIFVKEMIDPFDTGEFTVTGGTPGKDYAFCNGELHIYPASYATLRIENTNKTKVLDHSIIIHKDRSVKLIFAGINIWQNLGNDTMSPVTIAPYSNGDVTIELLEGSENTIIPAYGSAGIEKSSTADNGTLTITGKGSLMVKGTELSAAIGAAGKNSTANIIINGGTIIADNKGSNAAAIGGGFYESSAENIVINGGKIIAESYNGAAIGGGRHGKGTRIIINGGQIEASSNIDTAIGFGEGSWKESDYTDYPVISKNASVKTNSKRENYRNSGGERVYAAKIENESGGDIYVDSLKLDCVKHFNEKAVYVYLTGENHTVAVGGKEYIYAFNRETLTFRKHSVHEHIFSSEWMFNETYHCHPCTAEDCDYEIGEYALFTGDDLINSGYDTHKFTDFVCKCGFEDIQSCREYYSGRLNILIISGKDAAEIRKKALEDLEELTTVAQIRDCYDKCLADIDAIIKELSAAVANAADEINKTLDGYKALLETEHGYDITEIGSKAENGIMSLTTSSSLESVSGTLNETLRNMKEAAVNIAKLNASMEIDRAAMKVEVSSDKVLKTASTAKKAIAASDSPDDILDILDSTLEILAILGTKPHEHTFSEEYCMNEAVHWYAATCGHTDLTKGLAAHTFGEGVTVGNTTTYTCTVCGYEKVETEEETARLLAEALAAKAELEKQLEAKQAELEKLNDESGAAISALNAEIDSLNSQLDAAKKEIERLKALSDDPGAGEAGDNICSKCGKIHADNFIGRIVCFFQRLVNSIRNLFGFDALA